MSVNFFDIKTNWSSLKCYLQDPKFIEAVNIYHWWASNPEIGIDKSFIETKRFDFYGVNDKDVKYVENELIQNYSTSNPYWFCQPCDCVELNSIVTFSLFKLAYPEKEWYVANINLNSEQESHMVITDKFIPDDTLLNYDSGNNPDNIVLYDLIYPLLPWYGKIFSDRSDLTTIRIRYVTKIEDFWKGMNYIGYFKTSNS